MLAPAINEAVAVATYAIHFKILMILSPVGLFWLIINLILINNCITLQIYIIILKMQIYGLITELLRNYYGIKTCSSGGLCGASGLALSRRRRGRGQPRSVGRVGALGLALSRRRRGRGQPQSVGWCGWLGGLEFLAGWLVRVGKCVGRGQPAKSPTRCVGLPKIPKIPKIPIALDDSGELKQLP